MNTKGQKNILTSSVKNKCSNFLNLGYAKDTNQLSYSSRTFKGICRNLQEFLDLKEISKLQGLLRISRWCGNLFITWKMWSSLPPQSFLPREMTLTAKHKSSLDLFLWKPSNHFQYAWSLWKLGNTTSQSNISIRHLCKINSKSSI